MRKQGVRAQQVIGVFLLGVLLFNFPLLAIFNVRAAVFGIPILYVYLFLAWLAVIVLTYLVVERASAGK